MIAEIKLDRMMKKATFDKLKDLLNLSESNSGERVAKARYSSDERPLEIIGSSYHFESEVTKDEEGKFHLNNNMEKIIDEYNIRKCTDEPYIVLHDSCIRQIVDINELSTTYPALQYRVEKVVPISDNSVASLMNTINKLEEKIGELANNNFQYNAKCNVHVAGFGLISIKEVCYETDYCTDELQKMLNDGWRIIACCVQPDQRRPDYIFGKMEIPE